MNVYKQCIRGLELAIEREIGELFHHVCAGGGVIGNQAKDRLRTVKHAAIKLRELVDEEERNHAHEVSGAEASDVRGSFRQGQARYPAQGGGGIRGRGQTWEATEVRPQIEKREAIDYNKLAYKEGPDEP